MAAAPDTTPTESARSSANSPTPRTPWAWIPSLYLAEGLPYVIVMSVSVIMYKNLGLSNTEIAFYTSSLYLPWVIKPLWSPVVDLIKTRRMWIWVAQLFIGAGFAGAALSLQSPDPVKYSLIFLWLLAFSSATHDIAADGFYILGTTDRQQAFFVGIRSLFYRLATITGQGFLVVFAGALERRTGNIAFAWTITFLAVAGLFLLFGLYHAIALPRPAADRPGMPGSIGRFLSEFGATFAAFFRKPGIVLLIAYLLLYRFAEAHLVKIVLPFLRDPREVGGLGLSTEKLGFYYGTIGVIALICGGLLGGIAVSRRGLKFWLWWMALAIHLPDAVFIYLAYAQPDNAVVITSCIAIEQFGYGFGFAAYMLYMIYCARGEHSTAHYAICTGFMALGMMLPGSWSGWLQDSIGYQQFFVWVMVATIPGFIVTGLIKVDPEFGRGRDRA